ncbi:DUF89 domain-containing protein [Planctomycetota bacterium]
MNATLDCLPCFIRQTLDAVRMATDDKKMQNQVLRQVLYEACVIDLDRSPPLVCQQLLELVGKLTGETDPYAQEKVRCNQTVLDMVDMLREQVATATDPLAKAVRLAIAGNVIDFGIYGSISSGDIQAAIRNCLSVDMHDEAFDDFRNAIKTAGTVLYLADNAGEIVLDRLLIETMDHPGVTVAVRGGPILNDATLIDAEAVRLRDVTCVIDNGSRAPGTVLEECSSEFCRIFQDADLIIAKGQGNYESLHDVDKDIFFLLKAKCVLVARSLGCEVGDMVLKRGSFGTVTEMVA